MTKTCIKCETEKDEEEFPLRNKLKRTRHGKCKKCQRAYSKEHYKANKTKHNQRRHENNKTYRKRNKEFIVGYLKTHPCVDCREEDHVVLEFDHVRGTKIHNISDMSRKSYSISMIKEEIAKCDVKCANCHRRRHFLERQNNGE